MGESPDFDNRSTNASAESFNAKVKAFRSQSRGVRDIPFFIFGPLIFEEGCAKQKGQS